MKDNHSSEASVEGGQMKYTIRKIKDYIDVILSRWENIADCDCVCVTLGPYRNLTTLTASVLFLHPNCQVLNHAGRRVFRHPQLEFLTNYNKQKLDRFIQYAIRLSTTGDRGAYGGSITHSHAFDPKHDLNEAFVNSGGKILKDKIKCLFWKESLRTTNLIREHNVDLGKILEQEKRLRFILPIRNPLDCARSNIKTGHVRIFRGLSANPTEMDVVQAVVDEIVWFTELQKAHPDKFFSYCEHEISRQMLIDLATFLQIEPLDSWLDTAIPLMKLKSGYEHSPELVAFYRRIVNDKCSGCPDLQRRLLLFNSRS
jgi:hypothetical protein